VETIILADFSVLSGAFKRSILDIKTLSKTLSYVLLAILLWFVASCGRPVQVPNWKDLIDQADSLSQAGHINEAIGTAREALKCVTSDSSRAVALNALGNLLCVMADYDSAKLCLDNAYDIRERLFAKKWPNLDIAESQNSLGVFYYKMESYRKSDSLIRQALISRKEILGSENLLVAESEKDLGRVLRRRGKDSVEVARSLFRHSLKIQEELSGQDRADMAENLIEFGYTFWGEARYDSARQYHQRAANMFENTLASANPNHPALAMSLDALACTYDYLGKYKESEWRHKEAVRIWENAFGEGHPDVAKGLHNLASSYIDQGRYDEALPQLAEAFEIDKEKRPPRHKSIAFHSFDLARLYIEKERLSKAESSVNGYRLAEAFLDSAKSIWSDDSVSNSEHIAACLLRLGMIEEYQSHYHAADSLFRESLRIWYAKDPPNPLRTADCISELALLYSDSGLWKQAHDSAKKACNIYQANFESHFRDSLEQDALRFSRFWRKEVDTYLSLLLDYPDTSASHLEETADFIFSSKGAISEAIVSKSRAADSSRNGQNLNFNVKAKEICAALPSEVALVEYLRYDHEMARGKTESRYLAVVANSKKEIRIIRLGSSEPIESYVDWYQSYFAHPDVRRKEDFLRISRNVYNAIIKPIESGIKNAEMIFIAPDGKLNLVSFATLIDDSGRYLVENHAIHYLFAGRDLLRDNFSSESARGAVIVGNPDFNVDLSQVLNTTPLLSTAVNSIESLLRDRLDSVRIPPIPMSQNEIDTLKKLLESSGVGTCNTLAGTEASEQNFRLKAQGKQAIHVATHTLFVPEKPAVQPLAGMDMKDLPYIENPLHLSGLCLAGINQIDSVSPSLLDGFLTAEEITRLDLKGTQLVVLSACGTALGTIESGEGVYGLQRAFRMAGSRTIIGSLWQIPDSKEIVTWMAQLYGGKQSNVAFAMQDIAVNRIKQRDESSDPLIWGAFVAVGDLNVDFLASK